MARAPTWLGPLIDELVDVPGPVLWSGPDLKLETRAELVIAASAAPAPERAFAGLFAASVEGDLATWLQAQRPHCAPGAVVGLLLPESQSGLRARARQWLDPFGREGRAERPLHVQCGALLCLGAGQVQVRRLSGGQLCCVTARLPRAFERLDAAFDAA